MRGAVLVCGTTSDAGKTWFVTGLCRHLARRGVRTAPFKAQNMAPNAAITADGAEIGHAQWVQALAAGVEPEAAMNPVLLRPLGNHRSAVTLLGEPVGVRSVAEHHASIDDLRPLVLDALTDLRARHDVVVAEGAGGAAEINLLDRDLSNLPLAEAAGIGAILLADIDRGGVFASLHGTIDLLPANLRAPLRGFVVNRLRGDADLLRPGITELEERSGLPCLGVIPMIHGPDLDAEDSLALPHLDAPATAAGAHLDVAVLRHSHSADLGDLDPLRLEPSVSVRLVERPGDLGRPDLVVVPATSRPATDLTLHRRSGLADALTALDVPVLGLGTGLLLLGRHLPALPGDTPDPRADGSQRVDGEPGPGTGQNGSTGLGLLDLDGHRAETRRPRRVPVRTVDGPGFGSTAAGAHRGEIEVNAGRARTWLTDAHGTALGWWDGDRVAATLLHGALEHDGFRRALLTDVATRAGIDLPGSDVVHGEIREARFDRIADTLADHLDIDVVDRIITDARETPR